MEVRLAVPADAPALKKLNDLFNGEGSNTAQAIEKSLAENTQEIVCVAIENSAGADKYVGFCCGQIIKSMCYSILYGDITEFFVLEEYRRQDVGKRLIEQIEAEFHKRGVNHLHHFVGSSNAAAQAVFHSLGYANTTVSSYGSPSLVILERDTDL